MATRGKKKWLYKKNGRYYADFRSYSDVGGGQEALIPSGERFATKKHHVAKRLGKERLAELRRLRQAGLHDASWGDLRRLGPFIDYHMAEEALRSNADMANLRSVEKRLNVAADYFGEATLLREIRTMPLQAYVHSLARRTQWEGTEKATDKPIQASTQRKYIADLSKLFCRARGLEVLPQTHRPFEGLMNRPEVEDREAEWLDGPTATLLLEAARLYRPKRPDIAVACAYTIIATLLLTGMRPAEGLGLLIEDIDFDRKRIKVRRNEYRRLKTQKSRRVVPLWPQLEAILRDYLERLGNPTSGILFPSPRRPDRPVGSIKRLVTELTERIDYDGVLTPKAFRHTYCAARLQTTDRGEPVALLTVARELGHKSVKMVEEIYGHVGSGLSSFVRTPHVEFVVEEYEEELGERLNAVRRRTEERNAYPPTLVNRVPVDVEIAVLEFAGRAPRTGPRKAAERLESKGHQVSASGVRWIWKRYGLHRAEYRLEAIENGRLDQVIEEVRALRAA